MTMTLLPPQNADQTPILRAFVTLLHADPATLESRLALDVLAEAARDGAIGDAVKAIARG